MPFAHSVRTRPLSIVLVLVVSGSAVALSGCLGGASTPTLGLTPPAAGEFAAYEVVDAEETVQYVLIQFRGTAEVVGPDFRPTAAWLFDTWTEDTPLEAPPAYPPDETVVMGADGFQLYVGWPCATSDGGCVSVVSARQAGQPAMGVIGLPWFAAVTPGDTWRIPWRSPWVADNASQPAMVVEVRRGTDDDGNRTYDLRSWDVDASGQRLSLDYLARYADASGYPLSLQIGDPDGAEGTAAVWSRVAHDTQAPTGLPTPTPLALPTPEPKVEWDDRLPPGVVAAGDGRGFSTELVWSTIQEHETAQEYLKTYPEARVMEMDVVYGEPTDEASGQSVSTATALVWDGHAPEGLEATVVQERAWLLGLETRNRTYVDEIGTQDVDTWHHRAPTTRPVVPYDDVRQRMCALQEPCTEPTTLWFSDGVFPDVDPATPHLRYRLGFTVPGAQGTFSLTASADSGTLVDAKVPIRTAQAFLGPMPWA